MPYCRNLYRHLLLIVFFLPPLCGLTSCTVPTKPTTPPEKLTIIGTADLQGRLDADLRSIRITEGSDKTRVMGGISRIATLIKEIQQNTDHPVIVLSSGDDLMGRYFQQFDGKVIFQMMDKAGYEVLALGNHEFDKGPGVLAEALGPASFIRLCSDLKVKDTVMEDRCDPFLIRDYHGIRIGFFSLMTEEFPVVTQTGKVRIQKDQAAVAGAMIRALKEKGAQVIVAVTHIGSDVDARLAGQVNGIDVIFGGHSHNYEKEMVRVNNTLIVNGGEKGAALVRLDVALNEQREVVPDSAQYTLIPVTGDIKPDPEVEQQLAGFRKQLPAATVVGRTEQPWDLTKNSLRNNESGVADLITDMIRDRFKVDGVLFNSGSFRGNATYPPGPVTDTMLAEIDEFESDVYLLTLQGKYLQQILEHSAAMFGRGGFLQVSGIRFQLDTGQPSQELSGDPHSGYTITRTGKRVQDVRIQAEDGSWHPLDPERVYQLASNDFLVKRGGDNYFWFKQYGHAVRNTYSTMGALLTDFFRKHKVVNPPTPDGRVTIR